MSKKLEKVLEYLINNQEDQAKELLHQVFIEKARAIHEELINMEEEDMDLGGDMDEDFDGEVEKHSEDMEEMSDEIDAEETMAEADDEEDMPMDDAEADLDDEMAADDDMMDMADAGDEAPASEEFAGIEDAMDSFEDALAKLKDEFAKLEAGESDLEADMDADAAEMDADTADMDADAADMDADASDMDADEEGEEEEEMDESWLAEFDDLEESVDLEKVSAPNEKEVGAGKYASVETNTKSPVATAPKEMFGAKPVVTGKGSTKSGYERESAPSAEQMKGVKDNRRKKATDGMSSVSKEGNGSAMLNKSQGETGKKSPLTNTPRK